MEPERARLAKLLVPPLVTFVALVIAWELAVRALAVPKFLVPPPSAVLAAIASDAATLADSMATTSEGALAGFGLSLVFGISSGLLLSLSPIIERGLYPYALFLQTVPI